ncbi:MAG: histidine kinase [Bacteroidales bacterium]|nr:histidine kinase [Bacteroidales bacterium]MBN2750953.1 histidine kinase [Bacteroidales bacterium]
MRHLTAYILLFLTLLLNAFALVAQVTNDLFTNFTILSINQGLPHREVNAIYQDAKGFMWIGTEDGLCRYDGYQFSVYKWADGDSSTLSANTITSITGDTQGNLWISTTNGLNYYNRSKGNFTRYYTQPSNPNIFTNNHIRKVLWQNDTLWIETLDGILTMRDLPRKTTKHTHHVAPTQPYYRYHVLHADSKQNIWFGGRNTPIFSLNKRTNRLDVYQANSASPVGKRDNDLAMLAETSQGNYYVGAVDGFYQFWPKTGYFKKLLPISTFGMVQENDTTLWVATGNGLYLFNPTTQHFTRIAHNRDYNKSLVHNHINCITLDSNGNIWLGTQNGVSILEYNKRRFRVYFHIPGNSNSLSDNNVTAITQDNAGNVWIGTAENGINIWDTKSNHFAELSTKSENKLASNRISTLYTDAQGTIWAGLWSGVGFNRINPKTLKVKHTALDPTSKKRDWYNAFAQDYQGNMWVGIWGAAGLYRFSSTLDYFEDANKVNAINIPRHSAKFFANDGMGSLFIATSNQIFRYDIKSKQFQLFAQASLAPKLYAPNLFYNIPIDFDVVLNVTSNQHGVTLFTTNNGSFIYNAATNSLKPIYADIAPTSMVSLVESKIVSVDTLQVREFNLKGTEVNRYAIPQLSGLKAVLLLSEQGYLAQTSSGLYLLNQQNLKQLINFKGIAPASITLSKQNGDVVAVSPSAIWIISATGKVDTLNLTNALKPYGALLTAAVAINRQQLVVFASTGIYSYSTSTGILKPIGIANKPEEFAHNISLAERISESSILFSSENGIYMLDISTKHLEKINIADSNSLSSHLVTCILPDKKGNLWVGTSTEGLNCYNIASKTAKHYRMEDGNMLPSNNITTLFFGHDSTLWVGTTNGLCQFLPRSQTFNVYGTSWPSSMVMGIAQDDDNRLWVSTQNGLVLFTPSQNSWSVYTESDGLPSNTFNRGAVYKLRNGNLAFGSAGGLVVAEPQKVNVAPEHTVSISSFSLFGKEVSQSVNSSDTITLSYKENFFGLTFSTLCYAHPQHSSYYYRMVGISTEWIKTSTNQATFTNLSPGTYRFEVKHKENSPLDAVTAVTLVVTPPFWQKTWFIVLISIIVLGGALAALYTYIHQINIKRRTTELEQKLLISQMNPHFIFNSLSAIQSFMYNNNPEEAGNYLSHFSRLVRLILENSRSESISLSNEVQTIKLYLMLQKLRFTDKFDYQITMSPNIDPKAVFIPPMLAQPFIENSIEHGIMHKPTEGFIHVDFSISHNIVTITVTDDGIGLSKAQELNKNRENHISYATSITKERIENLRATWGKQRIGIDIADLSTNEGKTGTKVTVTVPYKKSK